MWKPTISYCGYVPPRSSDEIYHSAKGSHWKKHKYIAIKNGKYIYPSSSQKSSSEINEENLERARKKHKDREWQKVRYASHEIREKQKNEKAIKDAKTTGDREWARRLKAIHEGDFEGARIHEEKSHRADMTYAEGKMRGYNDNEYEKRKGKKVTNPTAKKNQRKAKVEKAKYKLRSTVRKGKKKLQETKEYITDTHTGKKKPVNRTGETVNLKELDKKNKKRK